MRRGSSARQPGLLGEHGWAVWLQTDHSRVLFDTGAGAALAHNAAVLEIDLCTADAVALSHGHYDHTGGLREVLRRMQKDKRPNLLFP